MGTVICGKLNNTPYTAKFDEVFTAPTDIGQNFNLELICPNSWRATHKLNRTDAAFINLPLCNSDHQRNVQRHLNGLQIYQTQQILPLLLMNLKASNTKNPATIHVSSIVAFYKSGEKKIEKNKKRKSGGSQRSISSHTHRSAKQLRLVDNKLIGPGQNTTRFVDQLICLDDRSDIADVRYLLEHARRTASLA